MKYFEHNEKYNFVDGNNVFVGYDSYQSCCEQASWFMAETPVRDAEPDEHYQPAELPGFMFDTDWFESHDPPALDAGGLAIFRLVNADGDEWFLHIYNCHNGYYGHGFEFAVGDVSLLPQGLLRSGSL